MVQLKQKSLCAWVKKQVFISRRNITSSMSGWRSSTGKVF